MSKELIERINNRNLNSFPSYIKQIRFPFFKKLKEGSTINFDFPFTVLVGPNGSGKSSTLHALYGCPSKYNVSKYWFSTAIDPIDESGSSSAYRYIYKYKPSRYKDDVEVIQTRSKRDDNPDYWETARPRSTDGMAKMPVYSPKHDNIRSKTRWSKLNKNVVYIDFRSELSAFDKFFYFGTYRESKSIDSPQAFLRKRSEVLNKHIKNYKGKTLTWNSKETEKIIELTDSELSWVNRILGKDFISAKIVYHNLFNNEGYSIIFKNNNSSYSEAVAGSGEVSVVNCVHRILNAEKNSLILCDEPEVSLHPGAQNELRELLLECIMKNNFQVVISTHSEYFLKGLPNKAIKLFQYDSLLDVYNVFNECSPEQAFVRLGVKNDNNKTKIYVEDELAKSLILAAIKEIDSGMVENYEVIPYSGGAQSIVQNLLIHFSVSSNNNDFVFLDGDQKRSVLLDESYKYDNEIKSGKFVVKRFKKDISESEYDKIDDIFLEQTSEKISSYKLPINGGNSNNEKEKLDFKLKMLDTYHNKFKFLNVDIPEELIWEIAKSDEFFNMDAIRANISTGSYKDNFKSYVELMFDGESDSKRILESQIMFLNKRDTHHKLWVEFKEELRESLKIESFS